MITKPCFNSHLEGYANKKFGYCELDDMGGGEKGMVNEK